MLKGGRISGWLLLVSVMVASSAAAVLFGNARAPSAAELTLPPGMLLGEYSVEEAFDVAHPQQLIDFDLATRVDSARVHVLGPGAEPVPFQILRSGRLAVQADLPAGGKRSWKLVSGRAPGAKPTKLTISTANTYYEITNGITGVRIPLGNGSGSATPAPVQGIRHRDGQWTATGPNFLSMPAERMEVRFLERGPLKVVAEVAYTFKRPGPGKGYYKSTIELQEGQPSILFEEDTDSDISYSLNVYDGLRPSQARYRGHTATSKQAGYQADGQQYRFGTSDPRQLDAFVDLSYSTRRVYPRMAIWDPYIRDSGWYWQLYDQTASPEANLFGIFAGSASKALGAAASGVRLFTGPGQNGKNPAAGIVVSSSGRPEDGRSFPRTRYSWGIFVGSKGADLLDPNEVQPINRQMNLHGGINLNKIHRYQLSYPDPPRGYGSLYMARNDLQSLIDRLGAGTTRERLLAADPYSADLIGLWTDSTGKKHEQAISGIERTGQMLLDALVNGNGIYDFTYHYWHGALELSRIGPLLDQVLANPKTSADAKARVKAAAVLFASVLWDDDFVPLSNSHGLPMGNENMAVAQQGARDFYALFLANHPSMRPRAQLVEQRSGAVLDQILNQHGAEMGSVHYIGSSFGPTLNTLLQLRMHGRDPFRAEDRLSRFAEFYMNFLTPPEVRFGGARKLISVGDGSTQGSELYGVLASGFRSTNPVLSARLMGAWRAVGSPHSSFFGPTVLKIAEAAPAKDPSLGDATFPGWYSVLRHGWGTESETAVWFVNGDFYRDHRHVDHGSLVMYALGAPLSLDWGSTYEPQVLGGFMHSLVVPESSIGSPGQFEQEATGAARRPPHGWDRDNPPLDAAGLVWGHAPWSESTQEAFLSFSTAAYARARFKSSRGGTWKRSVYSIRPDEAHPIIVIADQFSGPDAAEGRVFSLNLTAQGDVETPGGSVSPILRTYNNQWHKDQNKKELPSAGRVVPLQAGINRLRFTGQWLIDWDLYSIATEPQQVTIGNWAHNWHPAVEQHQFFQANGRDFEERQHILRIRGNGPFKVAILPHRKGERREGVKVQQRGSDLVIISGGSTTTIGDDFYAHTDRDKRVLATLSMRGAAAGGIQVSGGPAEVAVQRGRALITLHGPAGMRTVRIEGAWRAAAPERAGSPIKQTRPGEWLVDYRGGERITLALVPASE